MVSVIVPAYGEEKTMGHCTESILESDYPAFEVVLVNDGSIDGTLNEMKKFSHDRRIKIVDKENGGKASALNAGFNASIGKLLLFADADGIFRTNTIRELVKVFADKDVGCCCGTDTPTGTRYMLTRLQNLQAHVGTGYVRRALAYLNCLPIVSGNIGMFKRSVLDEIGLFKEGFIGEDLELTWRVHRAGYKVAFEPRAITASETPHTIKTLWNQRIRWARGYLQSLKIHHNLLFRKTSFGMFLPLNASQMVVVPIIQLGSIILLAGTLATHPNLVSMDIMRLMAWIGLGFTLIVSTYAVLLDHSWKDLRFLWVIPLWVPYAWFLDVVMIWAILLELKGTTAKWNKMDRRGDIT
jgi:cellulose synthase/poly-beta-1,6-N-acetylglucosamine synthase-like glycosyltransferase